MSILQMVMSPRLRPSPFEPRVIEHGASLFTLYNKMTLPLVYESYEKEYEHLCEHVQIWDVACERQVEIVGPDALKLVELITPRDMSTCKVGQCKYAPLCDEHGGIVNDPIILRIAEDFASVTGGLYESWEFNADGTEQTLNLRKGLMWSDGEPMTTEDSLFDYTDLRLNLERSPNGPGSAWTTGDPVAPAVPNPMARQLALAITGESRSARRTPNRSNPAWLPACAGLAKVTTSGSPASHEPGPPATVVSQATAMSMSPPSAASWTRTSASVFPRQAAGGTSPAWLEQRTRTR